LKGLAETIAHNNDPNTLSSDLRFERFVESRPLTEHGIAGIRQIVRGRLERVSEELDDLMDADSCEKEVSDLRRIGVGLYYTE
jgi:hypothetical protein